MVEQSIMYYTVVWASWLADWDSNASKKSNCLDGTAAAICLWTCTVFCKTIHIILHVRVDKSKNANGRKRLSIFATANKKGEDEKKRARERELERKERTSWHSRKHGGWVPRFPSRSFLNLIGSTAYHLPTELPQPNDKRSCPWRSPSSF